MNSSAPLGIAGLRANDTNLGVTESETDKLVNKDAWGTFAAQLGIGYVYYFRDSQQYSDQTQWFPSIEPELNVYYLGGNSGLKGDVWRYGESQYNDLTYKASVNSVRLMFDAALTIVSHKHFSLYAKGGIGDAWNRMGYIDKDNDGLPTNQRLNLNSHARSNFAWEVGGGLNCAFNDRIGLSLEYLYADLGKAKSSAAGSYGTITEPVIIPADFRIKAQTVLLGLHVTL